MRRLLLTLGLASAMLASAAVARAQQEDGEAAWIEDVRTPATETVPPGAETTTEQQYDTDQQVDFSNAGQSPFDCSSCSHGPDCSSCCTCIPHWEHLSGIFGDYLFLRPRDAEVPFAVPINGTITQGSVPIQIGRIANVDPNFDSGFRTGFNVALSRCSSIRGTYTFYENNASDYSQTAAPNVIRSLVAHPTTSSAASDFLEAAASSSTNFQLADVDFRRLFSYGCHHTLNYVVGTRYAHLSQDFNSLFVDNGEETVRSNVNFDGGGIRLGLEGDCFSQKTGLLIYGRGNASFLGGQFRTNYFQGQSFDPTVVDTNLSAGRVVTILDLELGVGWTSPNHHFRLRAGYLFSGWYNAITTQKWVRSVQRNDFSRLSDTLTFDGLTVGAEIRF